MECMLRPWRAEDAEDLALTLNDREILDNLRDGIPFPYTRKDAEDFIAATRSTEPDKIWAFAITVDGRAVGSITATRRENIYIRTAEVGYYVARNFWGRGLATSAVRQLCSHIFKNTDVLRIGAEVFAENRASCQVLEKAGFQLEGILRSYAVKNGVIRDMKIYAKLRDREENG